MGWFLIVIIANLPVFYRIHRRLDFLEKEVERLNKERELEGK
jgi:hypothetical protein